MCGRFALGIPKKRLREYFQAEDATGEAFDTPRYNVAPSQLALIVAVRPNGTRRLGAAFFGQPAPWDASHLLINARLETAAEKPLFRKALAKRRCLVPTSGFYEWLTTQVGKTPYYLHPVQDDPLALAGFFGLTHAKDSGEERLGFIILTRPASAQVAHIHDREPVMLTPPNAKAWLDPQQGQAELAAELAWTAQTPPLLVHPVSKLVNSPAHDGPELTTALGPKESS